MSLKKIRDIYTPEEVLEKIPLGGYQKLQKQKRDQELRDILSGRENKMIAIVGPCSADNIDSVCEYTSKLAQVQDKIKDRVFIIPRLYSSKPRTSGKGYKGMLHQIRPYDKESNMLNGLLAVRTLYIKIMEQTGLSGADELLYPSIYPYFLDVLSYMAVGARSVENQEHRMVASGISQPVGFKNPLSGDINTMLNSVEAAQSKQEFIYRNEEVNTDGNEFAHGILRGYVNEIGLHCGNYYYESLSDVAQRYIDRKLKNPVIIVDASHSNSRKCFYEQPRIIKSIIESINYSRILKNTVKGIMLESYLEEGNQAISNNIVYGRSVTDSCMGFADTEKILLYIAEDY
jgi:3-deoxy-7-phosphoheptulonate synthase